MRGLALLALAAGATVLLLGLARQALPRPGGGPAITGISQPAAVPWSRAQPSTGVDISFPQCGRTLRDLPDGFVIVGLDGGMPDRANPCFERQWRFARDQAGVAVYVNAAGSGSGDPAARGRRDARDDVAALRAEGIRAGTPVWLDVELPEVWAGSQERNRDLIRAHMRALAAAGHPVGIYSAPALWAQITGDAALDVPVWLGIGAASRDQARAACDRVAFGGQKPAIVQRIATGSDGGPLDRNLVCPGVDLAGLVLPR